MSVASMNPIISVLLAMLMLVTPFTESVVDVTSTDFDPGIVTVVAGDEEVSFGIGETADDQVVFFLKQDDQSLYLSEDRSVVVIPEGVAYTPSAELTALLGNAYNLFPQPTDSDLNAIGQFAGMLFMSINPDALSLAPTGSGFTMKMDVDMLMKELDTVLPSTLTNCAGTLDPVVRKYTAALLGQTMDCAELAKAIGEMGLREIETGLTLQLTVVQKDDGSYTFLGKVCDVTFIGSMGEEGLNARFTTADGKVYQIDTADMAAAMDYVVNLVSGLLQKSLVVSEDGSTITLQVNTPVLAQWLNAALAADIRANLDKVNELLNKYRGWLEKMDAEAGAVLTAEHLVLAFENGAISLPDMKGDIVIKQTSDSAINVSGEISGELGKYTLSGDVIMTSNGLYSSVRHVFDDGEGAPFVYTCGATQTDANNVRGFYSFSEPLFGLFNTLSISVENNSYYDYDGMTEAEYQEMIDEDYYWFSDYYDRVYGGYYGYVSAMYEYAYVEDNVVSITTDTDAFRFYADSSKPVIDLKTPEFNFHLATNEAEEGTLLLETPEFTLNLLSTDSGMSINSSTFGFSADNYGLDGYIADGYERTRFGIHTDDSGHIYYNDGYDSYTLTFADNEMLLVAADETYHLYFDRENSQLLINADNAVVYTVTIAQNEDSTVAFYTMYNGTDLTAEPVCTITTDSEPDEIVLPAFGAMVDAEDFLKLLQRFGN